MELLDFIIEDNYELFLNSINSNSFDNLVQLVNVQFFKKYNSDYQKVRGTNLHVIMTRIKKYIFERKPHSLRNYLGFDQSRYVRDMPCMLCAVNYPCERCGVITPFDIFKIDTTPNRFLYSCRNTFLGDAKHMCLLCFAKVGNKSPLYKK